MTPYPTMDLENEFQRVQNGQLYKTTACPLILKRSCTHFTDLTHDFTIRSIQPDLPLNQRSLKLEHSCNTEPHLSFSTCTGISSRSFCNHHCMYTSMLSNRGWGKHSQVPRKWNYYFLQNSAEQEAGDLTMYIEIN